MSANTRELAPLTITRGQRTHFEEELDKTNIHLKAALGRKDYEMASYWEGAKSVLTWLIRQPMKGRDG